MRREILENIEKLIAKRNVIIMLNVVQQVCYVLIELLHYLCNVQK